MVSGKWFPTKKGAVIIRISPMLSLYVSQVTRREPPKTPLVRVVASTPDPSGEGWVYGDASFFELGDWETLCKALRKFAE